MSWQGLLSSDSSNSSIATQPLLVLLNSPYIRMSWTLIRRLDERKISIDIVDAAPTIPCLFIDLKMATNPWSLYDVCMKLNGIVS